MRTAVIFAIFLFVSGFTESGTNPAVRTNAPKSEDAYFAYVSLDSEQCIALYKIDPSNGSLDLVKKIDAGGTTGSLAVDPSHSILYAAIRSKNSISSFRINARTGDLTPLKTIRAAGNPVYLGTDKSGAFLLTAYFADQRVAVYRIDRDGFVLDSACVVLVTEPNPHSIQTDPSNQYAFVPCRTGETILQYKLDGATGVLRPNTPDRTTATTNTGPRHFTFHSRLNVVYVVNEFASTVTAFKLEQPLGTLTAFQTLSTLPHDFAGKSTGADIHLTPDDRFLYASNRGHESIAAFAVDSVSGSLTPVGQFATEKTPRSFALDPTGKFMYAGGQGSGKIAAYRIDRHNGALIPLATYTAGRYPVWILTLRLGLENSTHNDHSDNTNER